MGLTTTRAADVGGATPAQATESDASYYTEDLPIAAYQPVVTRVTQPVADAGDEGDTEAPSSGATSQPAPRAGGGDGDAPAVRKPRRRAKGEKSSNLRRDGARRRQQAGDGGGADGM